MKETPFRGVGVAQIRPKPPREAPGSVTEERFAHNGTRHTSAQTEGLGYFTGAFDSNVVESARKRYGLSRELAGKLVSLLSRWGETDDRKEAQAIDQGLLQYALDLPSEQRRRVQSFMIAILAAHQPDHPPDPRFQRQR